MKVEITYDIIAKKIFEKGSEEDKVFLRSTHLIKERAEAFEDTKTYLTSNELEFIEPQEAALLATLEKGEIDFIKRSKRYQQKRVFKKLLLAAAVGLVVGIIFFYVMAYYNKKFAVWSGVASKTESLVSQALQMMDKDPTIALNLAEQALAIDIDNESAKQVIYLLYKDNIFYKNILTDSTAANAIAFSPDNQFVAYARKDFVVVKDVRGKQTYIRKLHEGVVNDLVFENSFTLLSVGDDNKIMRWKFKGKNTNAMEIKHTNRVTNDKGKPADINAIDVSPDGRYIVVGRGELASDCLLIDTQSDTTYVLDNTDGRIHDVAFSKPDTNSLSPLFQKTLIVAGGDDDVILVYDLETRKLRAESRALDENTAKDVYSIAINSKQGNIVIARDHDVIEVFNIVLNDNKKFSPLDYTLASVDKLKEHSDKVRCVKFSDDGGLMLSASTDKTIILWDTDTWKPLYRLKGHTERVYKAVFSDNGRYIASAGGEGKVIIWNLNLKNPTVLPERHLRRVSTLAYSLNGKRAFSGTWGNDFTPSRAFISWDATSWRPIQIDSFDNDIEAIAPYYQDSVLVAVGKSLFLIDNKKNIIAQIDESEATIKAVAIAPNNQYIAFAGRDDKVYIRTTKGKKITKKIFTVRKDNVNTPQDGDIYSLAISANSQYLAIGRRNRTIVIWDVEQDKQLSVPIAAHDSLYQIDNEIYSITFLDETRFLSTGRDNAIRLWEIDRNNHVIKLINQHQGHAGGIRCLAVHPSKKMYITGGGDSQLKLWGIDGQLIQVIDAYYNDDEPCTGDEVKCREDFGVVNNVVFSKDGTKILFGNGNGKIKTIYTIEGAMEKYEIYKLK
jgi:WD40 repeat protein